MKINFRQQFSFIAIIVIFICIILSPILSRLGEFNLGIPMVITFTAAVAFILGTSVKNVKALYFSDYNGLIVCILSFALILFFALFFQHEDKTYFSTYYNQLFSIGVFFLIICGIRDSEYIVKIINILAMLITITSILGIIICFLWKYGYTNWLQGSFLIKTVFYFHDGYRFEHSSIRLTSIFLSPNLMGLYLIMLVPFFLMDYLKKINTSAFSVKTVTLGIILYALVLTYSREAWLSCIFSLVIMIIAFYRKEFLVKKLFNLLFIVIIIGLLISPIQFWQRISSFITFEDKSIMNRLTVWLSVLPMIGDYPLTGIGAGNFAAMYNDFYKPLQLNDFYRDAHSTWLNLVSELGLIGFIFYLCIIVFSLKMGFSLCQKNTGKSIFPYAFSLTTGILAFTLFGLFDSTFWDPLSSVMQWIFIAMLYRLDMISKESDSSEERIPIQSNSRSFIFSIIAVLLLVIYLSVVIYFGYPAPKDIFLKRLTKISNSFEGDIGLTIKNISTKEYYKVNGEEIFPAASLVKILILPEVYQKIVEKKIDPEYKVTLTKNQIVTQSGVLKYLGENTEMNIHNLIRLMLMVSDSSAYKILLTTVGVDSVNQKIQQLGLKNTVVYKISDGTSVGRDQFSLENQWGVTTPSDMALFLEKITQRQIVNPQVSQEIEEMMTHSLFDDRLPRGVQKGNVAHKTGSLESARHDVGIISNTYGKCIIVVLTKNNRDKRLTADNEAARTIAMLANITNNYFMREEMNRNINLKN